MNTKDRIFDVDLTLEFLGHHEDAYRKERSTEEINVQLSQRACVHRKAIESDDEKQVLLRDTKIGSDAEPCLPTS